MELLFLLLALLVGFIYFGYPAVICLLAKIFGNEPAQNDDAPSVSLIIAAHNEERVIKEKVENALELDYPAEKLEILFALDGCSDSTIDILKSCGNKKIRVVNYKKREGKVKTLNKTVPHARGEIIIFSDANTIHKKDAIRKLVRNFADPKVGCVCGRLKYISADKTSVGKGENLYWKYEHFIKTQESRLGKLLVTNGSAQAVRKELYPYPDPEVADDFSIPLLIHAKGHKLLYEPEAEVFEVATQSLREEFNQKVRIVSQGLRGTMRLRRDLLRLGPLGTFEFLFHKSLRWFVPFFLTTLFFLNIFLIDKEIYRVFFIGQSVFYALAFIGLLFRHKTKAKIFYVPFYFCLVNLSPLTAIVRLLKRGETRMWGKAHSTRRAKAVKNV